MANILIIDDERYAVEGIVKGVNWPEAGISGVFEASCASAAMEIISMHDIDVILCDIEMPGMNGLELVQWIRDSSINIKIIFLTGHADFPYAQNAVKLNSFDYLLKPIEHEELVKVILRALSEKTREDKLRLKAEKYNHYLKIWEDNKKNLIGKLWADIINEKYTGEEDNLNELFQTYGLNLTSTEKVFPILISIQLNMNLSKGIEHELEKIGLQEMAEQLFAKEDSCSVIYLDARHLCIILYDDPDPAKVKRLCEQLVESSFNSLKKQIICYPGRATEVRNLPDMVRDLVDFKNNTLSGQSVCEFSDREIDAEKTDKSVISMDQWRVFFETEDFQQLRMQIYGFLGRLDAEQTLPQTIQAFYYGICALCYNEFQRKKISLTGIPVLAEFIHEGQYINSPEQARDWAVSLIDRIEGHIRENETPFASILKKIQQYIHEKNDQYFSRTELADLVNLNPDYLSRLFRKETGKSLSSYIIAQKMDRARELLKNTDKKISEIAEEVGYTHLSHFALIFRKHAGMSPYEYRKRAD